ncbi:hypothetical protein FU139_15215 [Burkholderia territorii]|nr:hypothetical protein FU139_15215 [Burkholderia territorii]
MTYAQFHESGVRSCSAGDAPSRNSYLVVLIDFSQTGRELSNIPEGRPARLCGRFGPLFNKVIHMRCG